MGSWFSTSKKAKGAAAKKDKKDMTNPVKKVKKVKSPMGFQDYEYEEDDEYEEEDFANYPNEPKWMRKIKNSTICNWFYFFFIVSLVLFLASLAITLSGFFARGSKMTAMQAFFSLSISAIAAVNTLFYYLLCDRSLNP
jgi:hypothetical protein